MISTRRDPHRPSLTIEVRSPGLDRTAPVVVILPTFRRPQALLRTLASLKQGHAGRAVAVIVMENDAEGREGLEAARPLFESGELAGLVLVAHDRGNCSAYNAGFAAARSEFPDMAFCLVIDDDEAAGEGWVDGLVETAERLGADIVGGPQVPIFEANGARALTGHPVFWAPYARTGLVPILFSSGNVCIRRRVLDAMGDPVLDTAFNFIGGGDADFYTRCRDRGFRFAWCAEAPVFETMPARRTEFSWLHARSLRNGAISSLIEHRNRTGAGARARTLAKSLGLLLAAPPRALALALRTRSALIGLYPLQVAIGRFQAEFGLVGEQYRRPESN